LNVFDAATGMTTKTKRLNAGYINEKALAPLRPPMVQNQFPIG
jgi:hypothetical protein